MYRRQPSAALPLSMRAVAASEPDVLVTHLAIPRACDYDSVSAGPWCMTDWSGSLRPVMAELSACPTFSRMKLGRSAVLLVSPGWAPMASSYISILRCRATAGSSGHQCVLLARCWNIRNSCAASNIKLVRHVAPTIMMDLCGRKQVADMLLERTLCVYDKRAWQHVGDS